jgi:hypothetical protein
MADTAGWGWLDDDGRVELQRARAMGQVLLLSLRSEEQ